MGAMNPHLKQLATICAALLAIPIGFMTLFFVLMYAGLMHERGWQGVVRHIKGEPTATQDVNDAADWLVSSGNAPGLEAFADQMARDFGPAASSLPKAFMGDPMLPISTVPQKFMRLGWNRRWERPPSTNPKLGPECVLKLDDQGAVTALEIQWGHRRHVVIVYAQPPSPAPRGFAVRKVTPRIYIVANES